MAQAAKPTPNGCRNCKYLRKEKDNEDGTVVWRCRIPFLNPQEIKVPMWANLHVGDRDITYHKDRLKFYGQDCPTWEKK